MARARGIREQCDRNRPRKPDAWPCGYSASEGGTRRGIFLVSVSGHQRVTFGVRLE